MEKEFLGSLAKLFFVMGVLLFIDGCFFSMNMFWVMILTIVFIGVLCLSIQGIFSRGTSACILYTGVILVVALIGFSSQLRPQLEGIIVASDCLRWWCIGFFIAGAVMGIIPLLVEQYFFLGMLVLFIEGYLIGFATSIDNPFVNEDFFWCTKGLRCFAVAGVGILCITFGLLTYGVSKDDEEETNTDGASPTESGPPPFVNKEAEAEQATSKEIREDEFNKRVIRNIRWSIILIGVFLLFWAVVNILQHFGIR